MDFRESDQVLSDLARVETGHSDDAASDTGLNDLTDAGQLLSVLARIEESQSDVASDVAIFGWR